MNKFCPHIDFSVSLKNNIDVLAHADHDFEQNQDGQLSDKEIKPIDIHGLLGTIILHFQ